MRKLRIALIVVGVFVALLLSAWLVLSLSLPKTRGTTTIAGLDGQVEVVRDAAGIPHIFASTDHDAFFAQGYVHAQDRMFQMEFQRRTGAGRLSEMLGKATLDTDKFLRTVGFYRAARSAFDALNPQSKAVLEAYTAGINAWLGENQMLPLEFVILGVQPEPWTVYDSLVWSKMMMWDLGGNWDSELLRARLLPAVGAKRAAALLPGYPQNAPAILAGLDDSAASALLRLDDSLQSMLHLGGINAGSNSWVVAGSRTASGKPMLANDPHLGSQIPAIWYLVELQGDKLHVTGASLPGIPGVIIGHNNDIAWGLTNLGPDVQDLYIERLNPDNPNQYEVDGKFVDLTIVEEIIRVKDVEEPLQYAARSTRHGPLISDVVGSAGQPLALRWTALDAGDTTLNAFIGAAYAGNWDQFRTALKDFVAPSQNMVFADNLGNIGYIGPGRIPIRAQGDGSVPVPGWDSQYEWTGYIPFDKLPQAFNPAAGYIVTANNRVVGDDYPYFITNDWAPPYRAQRITELLLQLAGDSDKLTLADMARIQGDQRSAQARELLPFLQAVQPEEPREEQALAQLKAWDGTLAQDSVPATIYEAWFYQIGRVLFEDELHGDLYEQFAKRKHPVYLAAVLGDARSNWCDDVLSVPREDCAAAAHTALERALDQLEKLAGSNMNNWQWGQLHKTQFPHKPFSEVAVLKPLFHRQIANGGDSYTVNEAGYPFTSPFLQNHLASYRQLIDMADPNADRFINTTGQSGNVLSAHYADLISRHQAVEYLPMTFGRAQVQGAVLVLVPRSK